MLFMPRSLVVFSRCTQSLFGSRCTVSFTAYRAVSSASEQDVVTTTSRVFKSGQPAPRLLPFAVAPQHALAAFKQYQRDCCYNLHASNVLGSEHVLQPLYMPFWTFEATISTEAVCTVGRKEDPSAGKNTPLVWSKMPDWKVIRQHMTIPHGVHFMQVYAGYNLRRDLAEAAKPTLPDYSTAINLSTETFQVQQFPDLVAQAKPSSNGTHSQQVPLELPLMRQAIAWQLCHRQLMHEQIQVAADVLKRELKAVEVKDLQVRMQVHTRSARLEYFPAYHLHYIHGEKYTPSRGDIIPAHYDALVGAADKKPRVAAELHPSPIKSQAAAAATVAGVGMGVLPLTSLALGVDPGFISFAGADTVLVAVLAATGAGALASHLPLIARNRHAAAQAEADRSFFKQYDQREAAYGLPDDHTLWLWRDADWRRWERDEPWDWDAGRRRAQAEDLFKQHMQREVDKAMAQKQHQETIRKREEEEAREAQRATKFGRDKRFAYGGQEEAGMRSHGQHHGAHRRRKDFLGYYKALGINLEETGVAGPMNADFIKTHYKAAALKLHPDKHVHADEATQRRTAERFRRLQVAYEVLKDAEKRRAYDQGRLVH